MVACACAAPPATAQIDPPEGPIGSVTGVVWDSIAGEALVDAAVFLWDTRYRTTTDTVGRFVIEGVPVGEYQALFFHERLGRRGVSPGMVAVEVRAGEVSDLRLGTPGMATMLAFECLTAAERPDKVGAVAGRVWDAESQVGLVGAHVELSWDEGNSRTPGRIEAWTSADGWYASCAVPADVPVLVSADYYGRGAVRREIAVAENGFVQAPIALYEIEPSEVSVQLVDRTTGDAVEGAEAWLRGTEFRAVSNGAGTFSFDDVPPGEYMLMTNHLAYGTKMDTLVVPDADHLAVQMLLDNRPIEVAPIVVTAAARPVEIDRRRGGLVITKAQIDEVRQQSRDASDILRSLHVPGVMVRPNSDGSVCVGFVQGMVRMFTTGCEPMLIFVNDIRAADPYQALRLSPDAVERMVLYKPLEAGNLFGLGGGNGVWMIYTRGN